MHSSIDPTQIFIRNWEIYQKVISANYMKHLELGEHAQKHLHYFNQFKPLSILDLGCGDAKQLSEQLKSLTVCAYTGYDLSEQATSFALKNLDTSISNPTFKIGKMEELIKADTETYNVIYSSFAIHHLRDEKKQELINDCYSKLDKKGLFILIDIKREPAQSIESYKTSYTNWILNDWHELNIDEKEAIIDHLSTCDIPVELTSYIEFAEKAGFDLIEEVNVDSRHALLAFTKN